MVFRIIGGVGLFLAGFYLGHQLGRARPVREHLERLQKAEHNDRNSVRRESEETLPASPEEG
jgi:hypothetical protein